MFWITSSRKGRQRDTCVTKIREILENISANTIVLSNAEENT